MSEVVGIAAYAAVSVLFAMLINPMLLVLAVLVWIALAGWSVYAVGKFSGGYHFSALFLAYYVTSTVITTGIIAYSSAMRSAYNPNAISDFSLNLTSLVNIAILIIVGFFPGFLVACIWLWRKKSKSTILCSTVNTAMQKGAISGALLLYTLLFRPFEDCKEIR